MINPTLWAAKPTLQIISDIHAEMRDPTIDGYKWLEPSATHLALLGDICTAEPEKIETTYRPFLKHVSSLYRHVFLVPGNHEYYKSDMKEADDRLKKLCSEFRNVSFFNKQTYDVPCSRIRLLGATLWSKLPEDRGQYLTMVINDYQLISRNGKPMTVQDTNALHTDAISWLNEELTTARSMGKTVIVLTHHGPLLPTPSERVLSGMGCYTVTDHAYFTDLLNFIAANSIIVAWFHGHSHTHLQKTVDFNKSQSVLVARNPFGYPWQYTAYNPKTVFTLA